MSLFEYACNHCEKRFDKIKPMSERASHDCPKCGQPSPLVMSVFYDHWPWILTEASHHRGAIDQWVKDVPSNDPIVDNTKAPYIKTIF